MNDRQPSYDLPTERLILAAYMIRGVEAQDVIESIVAPEDMYSGAHEVCFAALKSLRSRGAPTHAMALKNELEKMGKLGMAGGTVAVDSITDSVPPRRSLEELCASVNALSTVRQAQSAALEAYGAGFGVAAHDANAYLDETSAKIARATERRVASETTAHLSEVAAGVMDRALSAYNSGKRLTGITTGFKQLDHVTTGYHPGELIVVAGRPGMGKSALVQASGLKIAADDWPVLIFSLEMPKPNWAQRALSSLSDVAFERIRTAGFISDDLARLDAAQRMLKQIPIECDDNPMTTVIDVRIKARRMKRKYGRIGAVVVDYIQLMRPATKTDSREQAVAEISRGLKALAGELGCPVLAVAQVNRAAEKGKADKRPMLSDLRESGAIEQDADVVLFVYRDEYYNKDTAEKGMAEIIVAKQRNGPQCTVHVEYVAHCMRFQNVREDRYAPQ